MSRLVNTWQARLCFSVTLATLLSVGLSGCASSGGNKGRAAPIEDRSVKPGNPQPLSSATSVAKPTQAPSANTAAVNKSEAGSKPLNYTVKPGDTLRAIARDMGVSWQDMVRWNKLDNPNQIEVGQVLWLVSPPPGAVATASDTNAAQPNASTGGSRPVASVVVGESAPASQTSNATGSGTQPASSPAVRPPAAPASQAQAGVGSNPTASQDDAVVWNWPSNGQILTPFDPQKNKGISIAGNMGDPVVAAADGVVVYAGSGLRGYGNLVILKHNATFLTAYAHNQALLVKEDQQVRRGQKIAEMGSSDSDRVKLHFEVRRNSTPVDPLRYLPGR